MGHDCGQVETRVMKLQHTHQQKRIGVRTLRTDIQPLPSLISMAESDGAGKVLCVQIGYSIGLLLFVHACFFVRVHFSEGGIEVGASRSFSSVAIPSCAAELVSH